MSEISFIEPSKLHSIQVRDDIDEAVVDVRNERSSAGHITGSLHVPNKSFDHKMDSLVQATEGKDVVVFYCTRGHDHAPRCAQKFAESADPGIKVKVLQGGYDAWERARKRTCSCPGGC